MKDKMILKDGTTIELEAGGSISSLQVVAPDRAAMLTTWSKLTEENLSEVQIQNGSGLTVGTYQSLILVSEMSTVKRTGAVTTTYNLREKTDEEKRLDALEEGQEVQNGAIDDLGTMTSVLAEQIEGGTV